MTNPVSEAERAAPGVGGRMILAAETALITLVALAVRLIHLDHTPYVDELNHMLAARSYLVEGVFRIGDGAAYDRGWGLTRIVAGLFGLFGESLVVARIPALIAGILLVAAVFLWVRSVAGRFPAWVAALLLCFYPASIYLSQQVRFYTLQTLFLWVGAIAIYRIADGPDRWRRWLVLGTLSVAALAVSLHFQILSLIGSAGVGLWAFIVLGPRVYRIVRHSKYRLWIGAAAFLVLAVIFFFVWWTELIRYLLRQFWVADLWAQGGVDNIRYYHWLIQGHYPTLWTLFPFLIILAVVARPKAGSFCAVIFLVALVVQSKAAWKSERYLFHAMPMFFALVGIATTEIVPWMTERLGVGIRRLTREMLSPALARRTAGILLAGAALVTAYGNDAFPIAWKMMTVEDGRWPYERLYRGEADWGAAAESILPMMNDETALIASSDLKAVYYFGRLDYILSKDLLYKRSWKRPEFTEAWKTKRPMISRPESLEEIMATRPSGVVIVEYTGWRRSWCVPMDAADYLERHAERVSVPPEWRLRVFQWGLDPASRRSDRS